MASANAEAVWLGSIYLLILAVIIIHQFNYKFSLLVALTNRCLHQYSFSQSDDVLHLKSQNFRSEQ